MEISDFVLRGSDAWKSALLKFKTYDLKMRCMEVIFIEAGDLYNGYKHKLHKCRRHFTHLSNI